MKKLFLGTVLFLTHTVQMKPPIRDGDGRAHTKLLNPHGSDETYVNGEQVKTPTKLLNPHGSDETSLFVLKPMMMYPLLNPHGSDETTNSKKFASNKSTS